MWWVIEYFDHDSFGTQCLFIPTNMGPNTKWQFAGFFPLRRRTDILAIVYFCVCTLITLITLWCVIKLANWQSQRLKSLNLFSSYFFQMLRDSFVVHMNLCLPLQFNYCWISSVISLYHFNNNIRFIQTNSTLRVEESPFIPCVLHLMLNLISSHQLNNLRKWNEIKTKEPR